MAKETKLEKIIKQIYNHVSEQIIELKGIKNDPNNKELDVERWVTTVLKNCLGYTATNGYTIRAQEQKGKLRPDLIVYKGEIPIFALEVKRLGYDLDKSDLRSGKVQLQEYLHLLGKIPYGFLVNGYEWRLFDFNNPKGATEILKVDFLSEVDELETSKRYIDDMCEDFLKLHETTFKTGEWETFAREAMAFSPESLTKAILSVNVIKAISKEIKGEHDYKVDVDSLFDKVYQLIENGLDDTLKDFNESKSEELHKYIKSQKRACKKAKRAPKTVAVEEVVTTPAQENAPSVVQIECVVNKEKEVA